MNLPPKFITTIQNGYGEEGKAFLKALPESIAEASTQWNLTDVQPVPMLSYNFVAFANRFPSPSGRGVRGEGENVVIKMAVPNREFKSEMAALKLFNGEGACRLLEYDEEKYWALLERLNPGVMLATLEDDDEATRIAAEVMRKIWRPIDNVGARYIVPLQEFIKLTDWFDGLKRLRKMFDGGTGPLNAKLVERVESSVKDFFGENHHPVLMHGDFHHFNVLSSERGWLIIDPKGVIGPAGYEVGPFMMNPWGEILNGTTFRLRLKRRIDILHEHLGFERERIREWSLAHAILSAWWDIEENKIPEYSSAFAEMMAELEI
jgi:streptomycin 6-kinase